MRTFSQVLAEYKKALLWESLASRGNNCLDAAQAEDAVARLELELTEQTGVLFCS